MSMKKPSSNLARSRGLRNRTSRLARILDLADDAIISVDQHHSIILFNQGAEKMFGYHHAEILSQSLDLLLPSQHAEIHRKHIEQFANSGVIARRMGERREIMGRRKDGTEFPAEASISKVDVGQETMFTVIMRDVTQRTQAEERLKASLREKDVLLEEVHHRVKNNLQVISSLLGLQARAIADPDTRKKFEESQHRIQSMALLHEHLYQSDDLARIDFAEYVKRLAEQLFSVYGTGKRIRLVTELEPLHFNLDTAVPCGLIVNELLSNALKYGFPMGRSGMVRLVLEHRTPATVSLLVEDDGAGLPADFDWRNSSSLGLRLVRTLAEQLGGRMELHGSAGTAFAILFPSPSRHEKEAHAGPNPDC
jgi:PAS domain S-box-containing protein